MRATLFHNPVTMIDRGIRVHMETSRADHSRSRSRRRRVRPRGRSIRLRERRSFPGPIPGTRPPKTACGNGNRSRGRSPARPGWKPAGGTARTRESPRRRLRERFSRSGTVPTADSRHLPARHRLREQTSFPGNRSPGRFREPGRQKPAGGTAEARLVARNRLRERRDPARPGAYRLRERTSFPGPVARRQKAAAGTEAVPGADPPRTPRLETGRGNSPNP